MSFILTQRYSFLRRLQNQCRKRVRYLAFFCYPGQYRVRVVRCVAHRPIEAEL